MDILDKYAQYAQRHRQLLELGADPFAVRVDELRSATEAEIGGRVCLCNALVASAGLPQVRKDGTEEQPIVTLGDDLDGARVLLARDPEGYDATTAIAWLRGEL